jgi:hypothetical protein
MRRLSLNSSTFSEAIKDLVIGREIGKGTYRTVYSSAIDNKVVIKYQRERCTFDNVYEWMVWQEYKDTPEVAKWLAPCYAISASGDLLLQARTSLATKLPDKMPAFLCDFKPRNYGTIGKGKNKRVVCHDYGYLLKSNLRKGMRNVTWWETESIYK